MNWLIQAAHGKSEDDLDAAETYLTEMGIASNELGRYFWPGTKRILNYWWSGVLHVADALLKQESLNDAEVNQLLAAKMNGRPPAPRDLYDRLYWLKK